MRPVRETATLQERRRSWEGRENFAPGNYQDHMAISTLFDSRLSLPFRNANYGIYAAGNAVSLIGTWMQRISIGWLTWQLTHSGLWLGIVAFADFVPVLLVGPIAGALA